MSYNDLDTVDLQEACDWCEDEFEGRDLERCVLCMGFYCEDCTDEHDCE